MSKSPQPIDVFPAYDRKRQSSTGLRRLLYKLSPFPLHTLQPLVFETRLFATRLKGASVRRRYKDADDMMVNIGPGQYGKRGWVNIDIFDAPGISCVYDCRKSLPFPDNSVLGIFSEHVFEHIDYTEEAPHFLAECFRVLKPGGVLRIIVPDTELYLKAYSEGGWEPLAKIRELGPERRDAHNGSVYNTRMELINVIFRQGAEHKFAYDFETVEYLLGKAGFEQIARQSCGETLLDGLAIDKPSRAPESLYVEAVKERQPPKASG